MGPGSRCATVVMICVLAGACSNGSPSAHPPTTRTPSPPKRLSRRTPTGISITFALNDRDPTITAVRSKLRYLSAFNLRNGRPAIPHSCLPNRAFREVATVPGHAGSFVNEGTIAPRRVPALQIWLQPGYLRGNRERVLVAAAQVFDARATTVELHAGGRADRAPVDSGWALLAVVIPATGVLGSFPPSTFVARASDGSLVASRDTEAPVDNPCAGA